MDVPGVEPGHRFFSRIALIAALYAALGSLVSIMGWVLSAPVLADWDRDGISIKANTAIAGLLAAVALLLFAKFKKARALTWLLTLVVLAIGAATLFEQLTNIDLGIDTLLFNEVPGARATSAPGRMGIPAAISFAVIGSAILMLSLRDDLRRWASYMGTVALGVSALSMIGYLFGADQLYAIPRYTGIALQTATIIFALGVTVVLSIPEYGFVSALSRDDAGGLVFRRLVLPAIICSLLLGWLRIAGQHAGLFDAEFGTAIRTLAEIALLLCLLWITTRSISRLDTETQLLSRLPAENPSPVFRISAEGYVLYANAPAAALGIDWNQHAADPVASRIRDGIGIALETNARTDLQIDAGERCYACTLAPVKASSYVNVYCSDITHRQETEIMLERRASNLDALYTLADRLSRSLDIDEVYEAALDAIQKALCCQRASILLFDEHKVMSFVASRGLSEEYRQAVNGHSPWEYGAVDCKPFGIDDIRSSDVEEELKEVIAGEGIVALGFVPLVSNSVLIGKFMVYYDAPHRFTDEELDLAMTIAQQIAFGVERRRVEQRRKEVETALLENDTRFRLATRTGKVGVWDWDILTGRITWSDSLYVMHGIGESGFDGTMEGLQALVHPDDRDRVREALQRSLKDGEPYELELRSVKPDGHVIWLSTTATVLRDGDTPIRMIGAAVDITDRKQSESTRARMAAIVESSYDAIISKDINSIITSWNRAAEHMFGFTADEVLGKPVTILFPDDRVQEEELIISRIRRGERIDHYETVRKRKDGSLVEISLTISPIFDESGRVIGASKIARDITEAKAVEGARRESEIMHTLIDAQEAERHRIARDLHDHLGQQLTALRLKLESLRSASMGNAEMLKIIDDTREQAERIDLDVNFLSWELRPTELEKLGLPDALSSFVREWSANYDIAAEFHAGNAARARLPRELETNLYRIVQEGLNNILKHADAKRVDVLLEHRDGSVVLIIEDDGKGFDADSIRSRNGRRATSGLGLIGMRERTALLGGTLEIETRPGEGTAVFARVPLPKNGSDPHN